MIAVKHSDYGNDWGRNKTGGRCGIVAPSPGSTRRKRGEVPNRQTWCDLFVAPCALNSSLGRERSWLRREVTRTARLGRAGVIKLRLPVFSSLRSHICLRLLAYHTFGIAGRLIQLTGLL